MDLDSGSDYVACLHGLGIQTARLMSPRIILRVSATTNRTAAKRSRDRRGNTCPLFAHGIVFKGLGKNKLNKMAPDLVPSSRRATGSIFEYSAGCSTQKTGQKTSQNVKSDCLIYFSRGPKCLLHFDILSVLNLIHGEAHANGIAPFIKLNLT